MDIEPAMGSERLSGHVVWSGFEGQEPVDRQQRLWGLLRERLGPDSQKIAILLAYTPHEYEVMGAA